MIGRIHRHMMREPTWLENGLFALAVLAMLIMLSL